MHSIASSLVAPVKRTELKQIRHGHWWRDDVGWGDIARNDRWDGAGGSCSDGQRRLGMLGSEEN